MSHFGFLAGEWPEVWAAVRAEAFAHPAPRAACFYARRALELAIRWLFEHDLEPRLPYQDDLSALTHEPTFKQTVGPALLTKVDLIRRYGNQAVHSSKPVMSGDQACPVYAPLVTTTIFGSPADPADGITAHDPKALGWLSPALGAGPGIRADSGQDAHQQARGEKLYRYGIQTGPARRAVRH
ncbi:MAG: type restriction protein res subunit [Hydrocarboniphaga sp.]|uniref:DUF4145 domain-containing protein n=1 Tax=Hydrocarboniphaga sp. TaxID=2033016 RepID=UPI00262FCFB7|nr:DUF4145 domain-containing protein [Hydrocarboniphaga sp.]MDB5970268.1 type restriction protein res subunit [Hydrocarboniphaga sp.]